MKKLLYIFILIACIGSFIAYLAYAKIWGPNVSNAKEDYVITIAEGTGLESLASQLFDEKIILDKENFIQVSKWMKYDQSIKPGRFKISANWSNRDLISKLRSGNQSPVSVTFNSLRTIEDLAGKITRNIQADSLAFLNYVLDPKTLSKYGKTKENVLSLFTPNTYETYWNTSIEKLVSRMQKETDKFWTQTRLDKAKALNLSPEEVYALASIVEKETLVKKEKPRIAGVYLNRLRKGMLLQADPTVVFAVGDFSIRRVLNKHLAFDSPYNTYKYAGLPPGPIFMPDIGTIDAVLDYEQHDYIFFCAKPDNSGLHAFAKNSSGHAANANRYRAWLNKRGIKK